MQRNIICYTELVFFTLNKSTKSDSYRLSKPRLNFLSLVFEQCNYTVKRPYEILHHPDRMAPESMVRGRENISPVMRG
jgi:hypothetical protein